MAVFPQCLRCPPPRSDSIWKNRQVVGLVLPLVPGPAGVLAWVPVLSRPETASPSLPSPHPLPTGRCLTEAACFRPSVTSPTHARMWCQQTPGLGAGARGPQGRELGQGQSLFPHFVNSLYSGRGAP